MTSSISSASGLRRVQVYDIDDNGFPQATNNGMGYRMDRVRSFSPTIPDVQPITHVGDDVPFAQDYLPPNALPTGNFQTSAANLEFDSKLKNEGTVAIGDTVAQALMTNNDGQEIDTTVLVYRQALDTDPNSSTLGNRYWQVTMMPRTKIYPKGGGADQGQGETQDYNFSATKANKFPWGVSFADTTGSFSETALIRFNSPNPPILQYLGTGDGTQQVYDLQFTPISVAKTNVWAVNGTAQTVGSVDTATKQVYLSAAPASGSVIAWYETSDNI